jgi:hypothetical protein
MDRIESSEKNEAVSKEAASLFLSIGRFMEAGRS